MNAPRIVLLRPRNADNLGAIARAMKNFGLADWVVVSPNPRLLEVPGLNRLAVKSGELLETVRRVDTLAEAIADCSFVVGTLSRTVEGRRRLTPRQLAPLVASRGDATWALVFGDERNGLLKEDEEACHQLSFIPSHDAQPSLNLAQAVVVYAYELSTVDAPPPPPGPALASDDSLRALRAAMEVALVHGGFLRPDSDDRHALTDMLRVFTRGTLTRAEAALWMAAFKQLGKRASPL